MSDAKNSQGDRNILFSGMFFAPFSCNPEFLNLWVKASCITAKLVVQWPYALHAKAFYCNKRHPDLSQIRAPGLQGSLPKLYFGCLRLASVFSTVEE